MRNGENRDGETKKTGAEIEHGGGERKPKVLHLIFVNICKELKCRDNRKDILEKREKNMTFKFM